MSRRKDTARRRQKREERRRQKKIQKAARQANQGTAKIGSGFSQSRTVQTGHRYSRMHHFLHWAVIAIYVALGVLLILGRHDPEDHRMRLLHVWCHPWRLLLTGATL